MKNASKKLIIENLRAIFHIALCTLKLNNIVRAISSWFIKSYELFPTIVHYNNLIFYILFLQHHLFAVLIEKHALNENTIFTKSTEMKIA